MNPAFALVAALGLVCAASAGYAWSQRLSRRRESAGLCSRCGQRPAVVVIQDYGKTMRTCEACAAVTRRQYGVAFYLFGCMFAILTFGFGVVAYGWATGDGSDGAFVLKLGIMTLGCLGVVIRIQRARRQPE